VWEGSGCSVKRGAALVIRLLTPQDVAADIPSRRLQLDCCRDFGFPRLEEGWSGPDPVEGRGLGRHHAVVDSQADVRPGATDLATAPHHGETRRSIVESRNPEERQRIYLVHDRTRGTRVVAASENSVGEPVGHFWVLHLPPPSGTPPPRLGHVRQRGGWSPDGAGTSPCRVGT